MAYNYHVVIIHIFDVSSNYFYPLKCDAQDKEICVQKLDLHVHCMTSICDLKLKWGSRK